MILTFLAVGFALSPFAPAAIVEAAKQPLELAFLFVDDAVLQRGIPVPVWGHADPNRDACKAAVIRYIDTFKPQPTARLVQGITTPELASPSNFEIDGWPKSLEMVASALGIAAKKAK